MVQTISLSSGCFINHESKLAEICGKETPSIELSGHMEKSLNKVIPIIKEKEIKVSSIHFPCPKAKHEINLAADEGGWKEVLQAIQENMELAKFFKAKYIIIHAFYCIPQEFPANDMERATAFDGMDFDFLVSMSEYRNSEMYISGINRVIDTLKKILPYLRNMFPEQKIVIENLNPRYGYGGICLEDLRCIVNALDGEVGICLDMGHLALTSYLMDISLEQEIEKTKDYILTTHIHQNFQGKLFVDRKWDSIISENFQEVDIHLPLLAKYRITEKMDKKNIVKYNSFFAPLIKGRAEFSHEGENNTSMLAQIKRWIRMLDLSTPKVLEYDSRFAPIETILDEYKLAIHGEHPIL